MSTVSLQPDLLLTLTVSEFLFVNLIHMIQPEAENQGVKHFCSDLE